MAKIMICDDAVFMRETIREIVETAGHEVVAEAETGVDAQKQYRQHKPDLVTMDILMKDSGVEAIKAIVKTDLRAKIIVVSILSDQEGEIVEAIRAGALGIVTKPVRKEVLLSEITRVMAK
ncbi:MAG: chemotaxis response regulator [uncultured bacterium]|nr:MAG: chemotaxis response regulator [uncultured bacterium]HLD43870.1 response regulator [bacterium]